MCEEHAAAGIACPSMESIGQAIMDAPVRIAGIGLGVCVAVALSWVLANILWIGIGLSAAIVVTGALLVRKTVRNLRDGRDVTWHPGRAQTQMRLNGAPRPAIGQRRPVVPLRVRALEAPKSALPQETAGQLAELAGAIIGVQAAAREGR